MQYFISVGEPSGDLHASNLINRIKQLDPDARFVGFGGPRMKNAGCDTLFDLTGLGVMFLSGVIANFRLFMHWIGKADQVLSSGKFDAVILIDYPGFNWWIARKAKKNGIPVFYYGVPQMWAWAPWRIKKIRQLVDYVICKLPFEPGWFAERGCTAHYVGHPYFDELQGWAIRESVKSETTGMSDQVLLLLPGSRKIELDRNLETLFRVARQVQAAKTDVRVVMGCLNEEHHELALTRLEGTDTDCQIFSGETLDWMQRADACVACSGSVSLELLHFRIPTVIVYKIGLLKMLLQAIFLRCKFITLTNLMNTADIRKQTWRPHDPDSSQESALMPEYLTWRDCSDRVSSRILQWLDSDDLRLEKKRELDRLARKYAMPGASDRAATFIYSTLNERRTRKVAA